MKSISVDVANIVECVNRTRKQAKREDSNRSSGQRLDVAKAVREDQRCGDKCILDPLMRAHEPDDSGQGARGRASSGWSLTQVETLSAMQASNGPSGGSILQLETSMNKLRQVSRSVPLSGAQAANCLTTG